MREGREIKNKEKGGINNCGWRKILRGGRGIKNIGKGGH